MSNVIQLQEPYEVSKSFSDEQIEIIKNVIARGLTENEFKMFLYICNRHNLDPIAKQIYAVKRGGQLTIQTGIDGLRLIAERTGKYTPGKRTEYSYDEKGNLLSATAYVKKYSGGEWHEISSTAFMNEYRSNTPNWKQMPHVMVEKCAESRALRRAFPADLSGIYSEEEMQQHESKEIATPSLITEEKASELTEMVKDYPDLEKRMLSYCGVSSIDQIKEHQFNVCKRTIETYLSETQEVVNEES